MQFVAHSVPAEHPEKQPHWYSDHISEVLKFGIAQVEFLLSFSCLFTNEKEKILQTMTAAIMLHDMGKLDEENQKILRGAKNGRLPIDHIEAGVAIAASIPNELMGWLIRGHHAPGLPSKKIEKFFIKQLNREVGENFSASSLRGKRHKRSKESATYKEDYQKHFDAIKRTEEKLSTYKEDQKGVFKEWPEVPMQLPQNGLIIRLLLSCLVNADHESSAAYSKNSTMPAFLPAKTSWGKRLHALKRYVFSLPNNPQNDRHILRKEFFEHCLNREVFSSRLVMCSAPVGLGKTTSVMAYLLRRSIKDDSSRIIVIAPFSNIIDQTVTKLRNAIVLDEENPEEVVAAHHHKAEFSDKNMRHYSSLWQAPVVVTTAVQFFETLASAHPSKLRKLSAIVGASIFIDESHACLPVEFLKITWYWLKKLTEEWGCNIVFSSGSLVEYWNDSYLVGDQTQAIPELFPEKMNARTQLCERQRVGFKRINESLSLADLLCLVQSEEVWWRYIDDEKPSCLIILNTVQSCAIVANALAKDTEDYSKKTIKDKRVLHLSTALAPKDRKRVLKEISRRQKNSEWNNQKWYLVATSCVEAGVDLDFSIGFRERCSVTSFLQVSGRINRHGKRHSGELYDFSVFPDDGLNHHPGFKESSVVFDNLWDDLISSERSLTELSTVAYRKEFSRFPEKEKIRDSLVAQEEKLNFQEVADLYKVISSDTATVIVDKGVVEKLELGLPVNWQEVQDNSVQIWTRKIEKLRLAPIKGCSRDHIYSWIDKYKYDPGFLGIMGGLIEMDDFFEQQGGII